MIFLALGSNLDSTLGDRFDNINLAISYLKKHEFKILRKSSYFESQSYPNKNNPKFINVVIQAETLLPPEDLASVLIFIEEKLERKRKIKNDPRTCDIDIIDYKGQILEFKYKDLSFIVPHKEVCTRNFVLFPLEEISPIWRHPKTNELVADLIKKLPDEDKNSIFKIKKDWYNIINA